MYVPATVGLGWLGLVATAGPPTQPNLAPDHRTAVAPPARFRPYAGNPVLTAASAIDVPDATLVADPFLFRHDSGWLMFVEVWNPVSRHGDLSVARSPDGLHWDYDQRVLDEPFHLSYPQVFSVDGAHYMVPESWQTESVRLYRALDFPYGWILDAVLVTGREFVDPTVAHFQGRWWMFVGARGNRTCWLYSAPTLRGPWVEHPSSPIVAGDPSQARPGGRALVMAEGTSMVRIAQDDTPHYGSAVRMFDVVELGPDRYAEIEHPVSGLRGTDAWRAGGVHHVDPWPAGRHWFAVADGQTTARGDWSIGVFVAPGPDQPHGRIVHPSRSAFRIPVGSAIRFRGDVDAQGAPAHAHHWSFGPGIPPQTRAVPDLVTFTNPGHHEVVYTVTTADGVPDPLPDRRFVEVIEPLRFVPLQAATAGLAAHAGVSAWFEGPGAGFEERWPHLPVARETWPPGPIGPFASEPGPRAPILVDLTLGTPRALTGVAVWTREDADATEWRVSIRTSTTGGPDGLGPARTIALEPADGQPWLAKIPEQPANYVRMSFTDAVSQPLAIREVALTEAVPASAAGHGCRHRGPGLAGIITLLGVGLMARRRARRQLSSAPSSIH